MSTIRNGQISLFCHFIKIIKGPRTIFQSQALSQKVCHTMVVTIQRNKNKCKVHYVAGGTCACCCFICCLKCVTNIDRLFEKWYGMLSSSSSTIEYQYIFMLHTIQVTSKCFFPISLKLFFLIEIHSMQGWIATTSHGFRGKTSTKRSEYTSDLFRNNLNLKSVR